LSAMFIAALAQTAVQSAGEFQEEETDFRWGPTSAGLALVCTALLALELRDGNFMFLPVRGAKYLALVAVPVLLALLPDLRRCSKLAPQNRSRTIRLAAQGALFVALCPLLDWSVVGLKMVPTTCRNIYQQQWQMARFLRQRYPGATV